MSRECCGLDDEQVPSSRHRPLLSVSSAPSDPSGESRATEATVQHTPDDDCCGPRITPVDEPLTYADLTPWWRDRALLLPALSGVLLGASLIAGWLDLGRAQATLEAASLAAGAWTFVPGALRRLRRGRLGVGLLMTIAAVGAVALGLSLIHI